MLFFPNYIPQRLESIPEVLLNVYRTNPLPAIKFLKEPSEILQTDPLTQQPQTSQIKSENIMPVPFTQAIGLLVALFYACFISVVLLPIFLAFNMVPIHQGEIFGVFRGLLPTQLPEDVPDAGDTPDDELPQARREWIVSRHEIMMGREFQIAQYRGFLRELHDRSANRVPNNRQLVAPPAIDNDSGSDSDDGFDIHDWDMSLP
ncbi:hypothetical protein BPAE_0127g00290 [Botrytis paeoniae]|uniref:Uncharacterized protein n=1 Tax=Botrytis paeoniae TaxID=278948 RepID=A0A4Z1FJN4_9HELO|nr:hypothetical protein BPAE_0127g00290 [Botrytis paeoniae]